MEEKISRRIFMTYASTLFAGSSVFGAFSGGAASAQEASKLREELTPEEAERIKKSSMAREIMDYFSKGYSCAESLFMVSLRYLGRPEDLVWIASGFGGGLYHKDLCGFLTGGIMSIGLSAGTLDKERREAKGHCSQLVKQYWKWWATQAPLHCCEIRKEGVSKEACRRLGQLSAARIEELIKPVLLPE